MACPQGLFAEAEGSGVEQSGRGHGLPSPSRPPWSLHYPHLCGGSALARSHTSSPGLLFMTHLRGSQSPSAVLLCLSWYSHLLVHGCVGVRAAAMLRAAEKTSLAEELPS